MALDNMSLALGLLLAGLTPGGAPGGRTAGRRHPTPDPQQLPATVEPHVAVPRPEEPASELPSIATPRDEPEEPRIAVPRAENDTGASVLDAILMSVLLRDANVSQNVVSGEQLPAQGGPQFEPISQNVATGVPKDSTLVDLLASGNTGLDNPPVRLSQALIPDVRQSITLPLYPRGFTQPNVGGTAGGARRRPRGGADESRNASAQLGRIGQRTGAPTTTLGY